MHQIDQVFFRPGDHANLQGQEELASSVIVVTSDVIYFIRVGVKVVCYGDHLPVESIIMILESDRNIGSREQAQFNFNRRLESIVLCSNRYSLQSPGFIVSKGEKVN